MAQSIAFRRYRLILLAALAATTACNAGLDPQAATLAQADRESTQLHKRYKEDERYALRIRTDTARGRIWMLGTGYQVRIYDQESKRLLRQIRLPGWLVVKTPCMPDLVLDRTGSAYVSSNVSAWLWRIDAASFQVWVHEVRMPGREALDVGFGALAFDRKGALYGLAPSGSSIWAIDVVNASASIMETHLPPLDACELTAQTLDRLEARR